MVKGLLAGLVTGPILFLLFLVADAFFYQRHGLFPGARRFRSEFERQLIVFSITVLHACMLGFLFGLGEPNLPGTDAVERGALFGIVCGLALSRSGAEAMLLFDRRFVPRLHAAYWLLEFFVGYTFFGSFLGLVYAKL